MLTTNMSLRNMLDFRPTDEEMAMLDLDVVVYCKATIISFNKDDNYGFIKFFFADEDIPYYFKNVDKTLFYDFDATKIYNEKFITIFELYSLYNYDNVSQYMFDVLQFYSHEADVIIDLYTHDSKSYRLSNLDGVVKLEQMNIKNAA